MVLFFSHLPRVALARRSANLWVSFVAAISGLVFVLVLILVLVLVLILVLVLFALLLLLL